MLHVFCDRFQARTREAQHLERMLTAFSMPADRAANSVQEAIGQAAALLCTKATAGAVLAAAGVPPNPAVLVDMDCADPAPAWIPRVTGDTLAAVCLAVRPPVERGHRQILPVDPADNPARKGGPREPDPTRRSRQGYRAGLSFLREEAAEFAWRISRHRGSASGRCRCIPDQSQGRRR